MNTLNEHWQLIKKLSDAPDKELEHRERCFYLGSLVDDILKNKDFKQ